MRTSITFVPKLWRWWMTVDGKHAKLTADQRPRRPIFKEIEERIAADQILLAICWSIFREFGPISNKIKHWWHVCHSFLSVQRWYSHIWGRGSDGVECWVSVWYPDIVLYFAIHSMVSIELNNRISNIDAIISITWTSKSKSKVKLKRNVWFWCGPDICAIITLWSAHGMHVRVLFNRA